MTTPSGAATVPIIQYDVVETHLPGFGCWFHEYIGTVTSTGRTDSGSVTCTPEGNQIANYSGGQGTLNDGIISTSTSATHLFVMRNDDDGVPIRPVITLHLAETVAVTAIRIYGGDIDFNALPGALGGLTVEIGGISRALDTTPFGAPNVLGVPPNDEITIVGTDLEGILTNRIVLSDFRATLFGAPFDQFSIAEISVEGGSSPAFAGTPGTATCHGDSVAALAEQFGGIQAAASALDFAGVQDLQRAITDFCTP
jgi:hypothetical protein